VWATIGDFHGIDRWADSITDSVAEGGGRGLVGSLFLQWCSTFDADADSRREFDEVCTPLCRIRV
jgi:hypothetical protein